MNTQRMPLVTVEMATELSANDISEICDATEEAIEAGGGFGWLAPPPRAVLEDYWRGVLLVPDYNVFLGKLDHVIAGSCQIARPRATMRHKQQHASCAPSFWRPGRVGMALLRLW